MRPPDLVQAEDAATLEETMWGPKTAGADDVTVYIEELEAYFAALPADRFPNLRSLSAALTTTGDADDARFEFGLDVIVRGLASMVEEGSSMGDGGRGAVGSGRPEESAS